MGLDSVSLIVETEQLFGISILGSDAEKIYTVRDMVMTVAKLKGITDNNFSLKDEVFERVNSALLRCGFTHTSISLTDTISSFIAPSDDSWDVFATELKWTIPRPGSTGSFLRKKIFAVFSAPSGAPQYDWDSLTADQFVNVICACNHRTLVNPQKLNSLYEIYIMVMAVAAETLGIDYYELTPEKSFTQDLGID